MKHKIFHKYNAQIFSAIVMLLFGMTLTFMAFIDVPYGEVPDSTQSIFGRCLMFSGSMLGMGAYVDHRITEIDRKLNQRNQKEEKDRL